MMYSVWVAHGGGDAYYQDYSDANLAIVYQHAKMCEYKGEKVMILTQDLDLVYKTGEVNHVG